MKILCGLVALVCLTTLTTMSAARADDCKACEEFLRFLPQYSLAGSVAAIGTAALHTEGHAFDVNAELADALKRQVEADTRIPDACRAYVSASIHTGPKASAYVAGSVGAGGLGAPAPGFAMSQSYPVTLMSMLNSLVASYDPCSGQRPHGGQSSAAYVGCLQTNAASSYKKFSQNMMTASNSQIVSQLGALGWGAAATDVGVIRAVVAAFNSGNSAGLDAWAASASKTLGKEGFLTAVQMLGWEMNNMYSHNRENNVGTAGKGIVTTDQALASMQNGAMYMINGQFDPAASLGDYAVICRDAAALQVQALRAGGFTQSYEVQYRTATAGHVDVIAGDPDDHTKLYLINWSGRSNRQGLDGSEALFEGSGEGISDYSINYGVANLRTVADVPSNMMKFLNEVSGGDNAVWDPLNRTNNSILSVSYSPDNKGVVQLRGVYGSDGNGATYAGFAGDVHWGAGTHFPGEAGVFVGQQFRPADVYGTTKDGTDVVTYLQAVQHAITPEVKFGANTTAVLDTHLAVAADLTQITSGDDYATGPTAGGNTNVGGDTRLGTEIRVDQTALNGRLKTQYVAGGNMLVLAQQDIRSADLSNYAPTPLNLYVGARATLGLGGGLSAFAQTMAVIDQVGARDKVELGLGSRKIAASIYEAGRITNDTPLVQDNTLRRVGVSLTAQPNKWLRLGINGEIPIEGADPIGGARVYGTAAVLF